MEVWEEWACITEQFTSSLLTVFACSCRDEKVREFRDEIEIGGGGDEKSMLVVVSCSLSCCIAVGEAGKEKKCVAGFYALFSVWSFCSRNERTYTMFEARYFPLFFPRSWLLSIRKKLPIYLCCMGLLASIMIITSSDLPS